MNNAVSRRGNDTHQPHPCQAGSSHVPGLTSEQKVEGVVLKHSLAPSEELYLTTKPKEPAAASRRSSHGLDLKDLDKLTNIGTLENSPPACQIAKMSKLISNISISIWKCDLTLWTKTDYISSEQRPALKCADSWPGSLLTQRLIINCFKKPSLKSLPILSPNKA